MLLVWWTLGKQFLSPAGCENIFPSKSCWDAWRSGSQFVRSQVNMADEAKFGGLIFEALVAGYTVMHCCREELGLFCWPVAAAGVAVFGASDWFAELASQMQ